MHAGTDAGERLLKSRERARSVRLRALGDAPDAFARTLAEEEAQAPEFWLKWLTNPQAATLLATLDDEDVGIVVGALFPERDGAAGLFAMWVAPEARGSGVGDRLVDAVVDWARAGGYARVVLEVGDTNVPAIRLYERKGFQPTGRTGTLPEPRTHIREHERALVL